MQPEEAIIYVAGNPDLYPLEYYDGESQTYQGAIPAFLGRFAEAYGYDLRYFKPGPSDHREDFAANRQVDLISGALTGERYAYTAGGPLVLLSGEAEGEETACLLYVTSVAPESFREDLRAYVSQTTQEEWVGEVLRSAGQAPSQQLPPWAVWGAAIGLVLLLSALAVAVSGWLRERRRHLRAALTDPETGLGTDAALEEAFSRLARDQSRRFYDLICIHLNLDHIGYLWGQEQTSALMRHSARTLRACAAPGDLLIRSAGGDLLVMRRSLSREEAWEWTRGVVEKIHGFPFAGGMLSAGDISAGICPMEMEYQSLDQALFHVKQCALAAGREESECRLCGTEHCRSCQERWKLLSDFPQGLERGEFQISLQFFVDAHTFRIVGGEALSRWKHPRLGLLSPDRYIPGLEEDGRISSLDFYCLEKTCAFLETLDRRGVRTFFLSCNVSRRTFSRPDFARQSLAIVQRYTFLRKLLILEVTESQQIDQRQAEQMLQNILEIRENGVRVIFDDFGMGFSSFHDLQDYPMDGLKLDKVLVDNMQTERGRVILNALVETGHRMGMTILAEGVEEDEQIEVLQSLRCDVLQGFRFSRPLPVEEAQKRILEESKSGTDGAGRGEAGT